MPIPLFIGRTLTKDNLREKTSWLKETVLKKPVTVAAKFLKKAKKPSEEELRQTDYESSDWNKTRELDLTKVQGNQLPSAFNAPNKLKTLVLTHKQIKSGLADDPQLKRTLPRDVKVKVMMSSKDIYKLLNEDPSQLTLGMAKVLTGERGLPGTKPLNPVQIAALIEKFNKRPEQGLPSKKVLQYLVKYPINKLNPTQKDFYIRKINSYQNILNVIKPGKVATKDPKLSPEKERAAIQKGKQQVIAQANEIISKDPIIQTFNQDQSLAETIVNEAKGFVNSRVLEQTGRRVSNDTNLESCATEYASNLLQNSIPHRVDGAAAIKSINAIKAAFIESVRSIENNFERTATAKRIGYTRATTIKKGSDKLVQVGKTRIRQPQSV